MNGPHNGAQEAVLNAIRQGVSDSKAIATWLSMDRYAVQNAIKRLLDKQRIRRKNGGGYEAATSVTELEKGVALMGRSVNESAVTLALAQEPGYHALDAVASTTGLSIHTVNSIIGRLLDRGEAVYMGRATEVKDCQLHNRTKFYGPRGAIPFARQRTMQPVEFRELKRDPFAHMKLAMETRR